MLFISLPIYTVPFHSLSCYEFVLDLVSFLVVIETSDLIYIYL